MFQESVILANAFEKVGYQIKQGEDLSDLSSMHTLLNLLFDSVLRNFCNEPMYDKKAQKGSPTGENRSLNGSTNC